MLEFGCGDCNQLSLADYPDYVGLDISETSIKLCRDTKFERPGKKRFYHLTPSLDPTRFGADMTMSLDVLYHLVEDKVFLKYIRNLFCSSKKWVVIYSSDMELWHVPHVRDRKFTDAVAAMFPNWHLEQVISNPLKHKDSMARSDFYIYKKRREANED